MRIEELSDSRTVEATVTSLSDNNIMSEKENDNNNSGIVHTDIPTKGMDGDNSHAKNEAISSKEMPFRRRKSTVESLISGIFSHLHIPTADDSNTNRAKKVDSPRSPRIDPAVERATLVVPDNYYHPPPGLPYKLPKKIVLPSEI
jgi:hypothetical protein